MGWSGWTRRTGDALEAEVREGRFEFAAEPAFDPAGSVVLALGRSFYAAGLEVREGRSLEPILVDGKIMGYTTSAAFGHTVGRSTAIGYVQLDGDRIEDIVANARFEVEVALTRYAATASLKPFDDPAGARLRK